MKILVTGGAGFIGSALVRHLIQQTDHYVVNIDKLTYSGNLASLTQISSNKRYEFIQGDICSKDILDDIFLRHQPDAIMHLAAESHVDKSIASPDAFIQTNIVGTYTLLEAARMYWQKLSPSLRDAFKFVHISTDEVFGSLENQKDLFTEATPYAPSSPYSASKASSDHLVRAWHKTYGFPVLITNCSNNYGSYQYPEKLIPLTIMNALSGKKIPIYGNGLQVRDWLYVDDHVKALMIVLQRGVVGDTYNIGGFNEKTNIDVVRAICLLLEQLQLKKANGVDHYQDLIVHVNDRAGHDVRYAIDATKIKSDLGWQPQETIESGLQKTVLWYSRNLDWCQVVLDKKGEAV